MTPRARVALLIDADEACRGKAQALQERLARLGALQSRGGN